MPEPARQQNWYSRIYAQGVTSLRYRDFRLVWLGSLSEHMGEWMELAGFIWLARQLTDSPLLITLIGAARFAAMVFVPFVGGMVADRVNRRSLLIASLVFMAGLSIALLLLVYTGVIAIWHMFAIGFLLGVATSFNHPARQSIVPNLVKREHLFNAISLDTTSVMGSMVIGFPIAGEIIDRMGVTTPLFGLRAAGALLAIGWLLFVKTDLKPRGEKHHPVQDLMEGFRYLRRNTPILVLVCLFFIPMAGQRAFMDLLSVFARDVLQVGGREYGWLYTASGLGALISLLALAPLGDYRHKGWLLFSVGLVAGLAQAAYGASQWLWPSIALVTIMGGTRTAFMTVNTTMIQSNIPDNVRGRVMSLREIMMGLGPVGGITAGAIAQYASPAAAMEVIGIFFFFIILILAIALPKIRSME
ncbi:MAG: MFS transporter [Dehalococcoidia bacterium]